MSIRQAEKKVIDLKGTKGMKAAEMVPVKYSLYIDQLALIPWLGKKVDSERVDIRGEYRERFLNHTLDTSDALLIALIADLSPNNPAVRGIMWRGHFLVKLSWVRERLQLLQIDERALHRRLRWLRLVGILDYVLRTVDGNKSLAYYRMSSLYWRIRARQCNRADKAAHQKKAMVQLDHGAQEGHGPRAPKPWSPGTTKAIQDNHCPSSQVPSPPIGACKAPPAERTVAEEQIAKKAFEGIRRSFGTVSRLKQSREERIQERRRLLAEQAKSICSDLEFGVENSQPTVPAAPATGAAPINPKDSSFR